MDIAAALSDSRMLGQWFGGSSWDGWRTIMRAAHGLPLTQAERAFFSTVAGGREPPTQPVKELWVLCGRRSGKDSIASAVVTNMAATFKPAGILRPGERATVACLAVDRSQAAIVAGYTKGYFEAVPVLRRMIKRETSDGLELNNSVDIQIVTSNFRAARGKSYLGIVLDEVAFWRDEDSSTNPDREIYRGLRPGMTTIPNSLLVGITSVYRRSGLAYERWSKHFGKNSDRFLIIHGPSAALNPTLDQAEIDAAMAEDAVAARADYYSEWRDDLNTFIPRDLIEGSVDRGVVVRPPQPGLRYVAHCDTSDGVSAQGDSFTAAIAHREKDALVLDWVIEIRGKFNTATATKQIADALKSYGIREIMGDSHARGWAEAEFSKNGIRLLRCELDRSDLYLEILAHFGTGRIRLIDSDRLVNQFCGLERRTMSGGRDKVDHPRGQHDDLANAVAGALWRCISARKPMNIMPNVLAQARQLGGRHSELHQGVSYQQMRGGR
jgi:hypothetical protein